MPWMTRWPGAFPVFAESASGARLVDVDGLEYVDLCLGDTGAMTGHALPQVAEALARQAARGHHHDAALAGRGLGRRGAGPPVRPAALAAGDVGHGRQPVRAALRPPPHRPAADRGDGLVLPRHRRRDARRAATADRVVPRPGALGPQVDVADDHGRRAVQRPRRARPAAGRGRRRLPADGAGADQHRHRAARGGLPRRASARSPGATACCWSSTRPTRCAPARVARPRPGASSPTSWWWASRSAAGCRSRRTG